MHHTHGGAGIYLARWNICEQKQENILPKIQSTHMYGTQKSRTPQANQKDAPLQFQGSKDHLIL